MTSLASDRLFGVSATLAVKAPVRAATTGEITLSGLQVIDAVAVAAGDRVLTKHQTDPSQNGIYVVDTGAWTRSPDFDGARNVAPGTRVYVATGDINGGREFVVTSSGEIVVGVSDLAFEAMAALAITVNQVTAASAVATAGQTDFALSYEIGAVLAAVNGVIVDPADYVAVDGATIAFQQGLNLGDAVVAYSLNGGAGTPTAAFAARLSAETTNATGAGTEHLVLFDAVEFDDGGGDYDAGTGRFTAPKPGRYQLNAAVAIDNLTAAADEAELKLATTGRDFYAHAYRQDGLMERQTLHLSALADMAAGDTASVSVRVAGEASDLVDLVGGGDGFAHFSGFLIK